MPGHRKHPEAPPFGRKLAALRKEKGWSQAHLAELMNTGRANIDYYENRAKNPTLDFVKRVAEVFKVPVSDLVDDEPIKRARPGPRSKLEERFERVRELPRRDQEVVLSMLDGLLESRAAGET